MQESRSWWVSALQPGCKADHAKFWYLCELLYVLSNCTLKIALGIFYLRVAMKRWHIWCIKLLMAGTVLFGFTYFFLVMFQCIPGECGGPGTIFVQLIW